MREIVRWNAQNLSVHIEEEHQTRDLGGRESALWLSYCIWSSSNISNENGLIPHRRRIGPFTVIHFSIPFMMLCDSNKKEKKKEKAEAKRHSKERDRLLDMFNHSIDHHDGMFIVWSPISCHTENNGSNILMDERRAIRDFYWVRARWDAVDARPFSVIEYF